MSRAYLHEETEQGNIVYHGKVDSSPQQEILSINLRPSRSEPQSWDDVIHQIVLELTDPILTIEHWDVDHDGRHSVSWEGLEKAMEAGFTVPKKTFVPQGNDLTFHWLGKTFFLVHESD